MQPTQTYFNIKHVCIVSNWKPLTQMKKQNSKLNTKSKGVIATNKLMLVTLITNSLVTMFLTTQYTFGTYQQ